MHNLASLNYQIKSASEIFLPAVSAAAFYGKSIFTTVAVYHAKPFLWENHWRRFNINAAQIGIDLANFSESQVKDSLFNLIAENDFQNGRARLTFFDEPANGIWSNNRQSKVNFLIMTADFNAIAENIRLTISPFPVNSKSPLTGVKSGNYLENILALEEAKKRRFNEAVRRNEKGELASAAMANIFWIKDEMIFTPSLETGALKGTTRDFIVENFSVIENNISPEELKLADEIFITSAGIGVAKIEMFEDKKFENFKITKRIRKFFADSVNLRA